MDRQLNRFCLVLVALLTATAGLFAMRSAAASPDVPVRFVPQAAVPPVTLPTRHDPAALAAAEPEVAELEQIAVAQTADDEEGRFQALRIVRSALKFPLLRIEEQRQRDADGVESRLLARSVVAADHLMIGLAAGDTEDGLARQLAPLGLRLVGIDRAAKLALVGERTLAGELTLVGKKAAADPGTLDRIRVALARCGRTGEVDALVHAADTGPDDPGYRDGSQWALARIAADQAWEFTTGSDQVLVGVIDSGIDYRHPDLAANVWTNPGESGAGRDRNGVDDDGDGYVDDVHGVDFVAGGEPLDDNDHGTHVAGVIGAVGDNRLGVAGVCWQVRLAALKILDRHGLGFTSDAIRAVRYATRIGCRMTSNAWCGGGRCQLLADAIADAGTHQVLFIAAAGNASNDLGREASFPACYQLDNLIAVTASDRDDRPAPFSSYGAAAHLAAPGVGVLSTVRGGYALRSGTSVAAAHVVGVCALLAAFVPDMSGQQIRARVLATVDPCPALDAACATGGRINAYRALAPIAVVVARRDAQAGR